MRASTTTLLLPLLATLLLAGCEGGNAESTGEPVAYEYWDGRFPYTVDDTLYLKWEKQLREARVHGIGLESAQYYHDQTVNLLKRQAREQGWEEYDRGRWRREVE